MTKRSSGQAEDSVKKGYEVTDAWIRPVAITAGIITFITIASFFVVSWFFGFLEQMEVRHHPAPTQISDHTWEAPAIQLQTRPRRDIIAYRKAEDKRLNSYAWSNPPTQTARIPIERAKEIIIEQGFPERTGS